jgi:hypothetical protein
MLKLYTPLLFAYPPVENLCSFDHFYRFFSKGEFRNDIRNGKGTLHMKSYAERIIGTYKDGKKDGEWIKLSATGEVIQKQRWNLGNFIGLVP